MHTQFLQQVNQCLKAVAEESSLAVVLTTPSKLFLKVSCERPAGSFFNDRNKKMSMGARPGE